MAVTHFWFSLTVFNDISSLGTALFEFIFCGRDSHIRGANGELGRLADTETRENVFIVPAFTA